jgi:hypothetical protein
MDFTTELVPLKKLKPHPRNYQQHPDDQLDHLVHSIQTYGVYRNIVAAKDYTLLAGHGVWMALQRMGSTHAPVRVLDLEPDSPAALKVLAADNEIAHLGVRDDRQLAEILKEVEEFDIDGLIGTGYDAMMLANLAYVTRKELKDFDEAAHWVGMPEYDEGKDRLRLVVSVRSEEDRKALMALLGVEKPMMVQGHTTTCWWPPKERNDNRALKFEENTNAVSSVHPE